LQSQNQGLSSMPQAGHMTPSTGIEGLQRLHTENENNPSDFDLPADIFANAKEIGPGDGQISTTPSSLMAELTSWGEFDSLVSLLRITVHISPLTFLNTQVNAGMGGLDFLALGDQNRMWDNTMDNDMSHIL